MAKNLEKNGFIENGFYGKWAEIDRNHVHVFRYSHVSVLFCSSTLMFSYYSDQEPSCLGTLLFKYSNVQLLLLFKYSYIQVLFLFKYPHVPVLFCFVQELSCSAHFMFRYAHVQK